MKLAGVFHLEVKKNWLIFLEGSYLHKMVCEGERGRGVFFGIGFFKKIQDGRRSSDFRMVALKVSGIKISENKSDIKIGHTKNSNCFCYSRQGSTR